MRRTTGKLLPPNNFRNNVENIGQSIFSSLEPYTLKSVHKNMKFPDIALNDSGKNQEDDCGNSHKQSSSIKHWSLEWPQKH